MLRTEPYRLLFPLGIAGAVIGIGIWIPYFLWPQVFPYPGQGHAVIQIQGFLLCFIFGFLTTMLPKILGVAPLDPFSYLAFPILLVGIMIASLVNAPTLAQTFHLLLLVNFLVFIIRRFPKRKTNPPPNFLFIGVAMLADVVGTLVKIGSLSGYLSGESLRVGSLLQYQAFPLLLILGVGGFLIPKLLANGPIDPKTLRSSNGASMTMPVIFCSLFLASFAIEILGLMKGYGNISLQIAYALRASVWIWFLMTEIRIHKVSGKLPPYLRAARISLCVMAVGMIMPVFRPNYLLAWEHVIFLSGFLRLTLSIASRVLAAHAGQLDILTMHGKKVRFYGMLIVFAMMTRIATEIWPKGHWMHLAIASGFALSAIFIWGKIYYPLLKIYPGR